MMKTGIVKFYNHQKKFGFIKDNETGEEYFVHEKGLLEKIVDEDTITFELREGKKGLNAFNVKKK